MLLQMLFLALIALAHAQGYYVVHNNHQSPPAQARCSSSAKPCRLMFELLHPNGTVINALASQQLCSCNSYQGPCSNDWTNSNKKITRSLRSDTMAINLNMMFCSAITPSRVCSNNEVSVEVSGYLAIPNDVEDYRCRCRDSSKPLYLKQRYIENYRFYHKYVCEDSWPTCDPSDRCMTVTSTQRPQWLGRVLEKQAHPNHNTAEQSHKQRSNLRAATLTHHNIHNNQSFHRFPRNRTETSEGDEPRA
ncbi:hypothetical protein RRG08_011274 [Elysia crispata]|uniref:Uncharacterized protein n=1 Tax=Elysia crispata TaxID=231223 RepID=A0AAE0Y5I2_9GAST|nr:hypothetical protein RRG08_011274 [Elysia crispata]